MMVKYTKEVLEQAVASSTSLNGVLRALGFKSYSGSMGGHIKRRLAEYGIDTSHFQGMSSNRGKQPRNRKPPHAILIAGYETRAKAHQLRRALLDRGVKHECAECGLGPEWRGRPLVLPVDHIDGDWSNNQQSNLRFLCHNCHSQTETFGR